MEYLDIVDENGLPTGETISRDIAHKDGILHRTAHVWIVRPTMKGNDILLQKRSRQKDSFPGLYDTSSAGHIPAGEEPVTSALRELKEELGIDATAEQLHFAGTFRIQYEKEFHGHLFHDNEVAHVHVYYERVELSSFTLQKSEVAAIRWFNLDDVWDEIQNSRERFCVPMDGLKVLKDYLTKNPVPGNEIKDEKTRILFEHIKKTLKKEKEREELLEQRRRSPDGNNKYNPWCPICSKRLLYCLHGFITQDVLEYYDRRRIMYRLCGCMAYGDNRDPVFWCPDCGLGFTRKLQILR